MKATIYHNPRCTKSRLSLALLQEKNIEVEVVEYLKTPPSVGEIQNIVEMLGITPRQLLRKGEAVYKENNLQDPSIADNDIIAHMHDNPILIERPVVVINNKAVIGRPPENILDIL